MKFSHMIIVETGLHGRTAAKIVNKCYEYNCDVAIVFNGRIGFVDSIMSLLNLEAKQGDVEYSRAAEPPVRCGESHLSGLAEPPFIYSY